MGASGLSFFINQLTNKNQVLNWKHSNQVLDFAHELITSALLARDQFSSVNCHWLLPAYDQDS
jgi:hypothetical protein